MPQTEETNTTWLVEFLDQDMQPFDIRVEIATPIDSSLASDLAYFAMTQWFLESLEPPEFEIDAETGRRWLPLVVRGHKAVPRARHPDDRRRSTGQRYASTIELNGRSWTLVADIPRGQSPSRYLRQLWRREMRAPEEMRRWFPAEECADDEPYEGGYETHK
jgi:hypothetical protein